MDSRRYHMNREVLRDITDIYGFAPSHLWLRRHWRLKERERNIIAAAFSIAVIAALATALAQPHWFYLKGGECDGKYIGVQEYFSSRHTEVSNQDYPTSKQRTSTLYRSNTGCVTSTVICLLRTNIAFTFLAILFSLIQFFFDTLGVVNKWLKAFRRNAVGSIITVLFCVAIVGVCYYCTVLIEQQEEKIKTERESKIEVKFDISYYLITGAGAVAILASAANLLRRYPLYDDRGDGGGLLDDYDGSETFSVRVSHSEQWPYRRELHQTEGHPPPPPYTP